MIPSRAQIIIFQDEGYVSQSIANFHAWIFKETEHNERVLSNHIDSLYNVKLSSPP